MAVVATPASAIWRVLLGDGDAWVTNGTNYWHCYSPEVTGEGWVCFAMFDLPTNGGPGKVLQRKDGWTVYAPRSSTTAPGEARAAFRKLQATAHGPARGSEVVVAELRKLFPEGYASSPERKGAPMPDRNSKREDQGHAPGMHP